VISVSFFIFYPRLAESTDVWAGGYVTKRRGHFLLADNAGIGKWRITRGRRMWPRPSRTILGTAKIRSMLPPLWSCDGRNMFKNIF
jgi:hypothetical protein